MRLEPRLSKSRYLTGLQCSRRLWLSWHDPGPKAEAAPGSILAMGTEIGAAARQIVPGGVLVEEGPYDHDLAVERTCELIKNPDVPAIFEAAFAFDRVLIRADILERIPGGGWRLAEVKSSARAKPEHLHDLAIQAYVIAGCGIAVEEMQLVHVDTSYVLGENGSDWLAYFKRDDLTGEVRELLPDVPERVAEMHAILGLPVAPEIRPTSHCFSPFRCEFWGRCTANKPSDWIFHLPHLSKFRFAELDAKGIESMRDIPSDFLLSMLQRRTVEAVTSGRTFVSDELGGSLAPLGPPATYLDFETFSPALPLYVGASPYQRIPFQWSMHHDDGDGNLSHFEFLANGSLDPRREFAETLLEAIGSTSGPVIVYSQFEASVLRELALYFPDLSERLLAVIDRIRDLLPIVRRNVVHPQFLGSYSIKAVAPALSPGFSYNDLDRVADGGDAAAVFYRLASNQVLSDESQASYRRELRAYCERDTLAMAVVHNALKARCHFGRSVATDTSDSAVAQSEGRSQGLKT